jgi:anti-sigma-K factor RskA
MKHPTCDRASDLAPALALDVVDREEREVLEAHVQRCQDCARELRDMQQVAAQLALAQPRHEPPAALGQRILARAATEASEGVCESASRRVGAEETIALSPSRPLALSRFRRWPAVVSTASLAAAVAALVWSASLQSQLAAAQREVNEASAQLDRLRGSYNTVVEVLASSETVVQDLQPDEAPGAEGRVWIDHASGHGMIMARGLPEPAEGQTYQVWLTSQAGRVSGGFLREYDDGIYYAVLRAPGKLTDYNRLGVTLEPISGSPEPTGPRVIAGQI